MIRESATTKDVLDLSEKVLEILDKQPSSTAFMALIAICIIMQSPDADDNEIRDGIQEISNFICNFVEQRHPSKPLPKSLLN